MNVVSGLSKLDFPRTVEQVVQISSEAWAEMNREVDQIMQISEPTFENTVVALASADARLTNRLSQLTFYQHVASFEQMRDACRKVDAEFSSHYNQIFSRRDLYQRIKSISDGLSRKKTQKNTNKNNTAKNMGKNKTLESIDLKLLSSILGDFESNGIHLSTIRRKRLLELIDRSSHLSTEFDRNIDEDESSLVLTESELKGCSSDFLESILTEPIKQPSLLHRLMNKYDYYTRGSYSTSIVDDRDYGSNYKSGNGQSNVTYTVSSGDALETILTDCQVAETRSKVKKFMETRYSDNLPILEEMHQIRTELAQIHGHNSSSHSTLSSQMMGTPENAMFFLDHILKMLNKQACQYMQTLIEMKRQDSEVIVKKRKVVESRQPTKKRKKNKLESANDSGLGDFEVIEIGEDDHLLGIGDFLYYHNKYLKKFYDLDHSKIKEYFPTNHVLKEMLAIYSQVLSLSFVKVDHSSYDFFQRLDSNVECYAVYDTSSALLMGHFLLDLYPREGKDTHFSQVNILNGYQDVDQHLPVVALIGNFPEPVKSVALLAHEDVETMFHEFGHVMHAICGGYQARYYRFSGNRGVEIDFNESPAELFEQWVWEPSVLRQISCHFKTGQVLDDQTISNLIKSRAVTSLNEWNRVSCLSKIDLTIFSRKRLTGSEMISINKEMTEKYMLQEIMGEKICAWGHIGSYGYDSLNYSYVWSMVLATDMYSKFKSMDQENNQNGLELRRKILEKGSSLSAWEMIKSFLGRAPNARAFLCNYLGFDSSLVVKEMKDFDFDD